MNKNIREQNDDKDDDKEIVETFKQELYFLNKKYNFLLDIERSNFLEVNHFISKFSLGLGWWLLIILILGDAFNAIPFSFNVLRSIIKH